LAKLKLLESGLGPTPVKLAVRDLNKPKARQQPREVQRSRRK